MPVYNYIGKSYSKSRIPDSRIVDSLLDLLPLSQGSVIADIGAGTAAGWRRPEIYLDADVRANISALALADQNEVEKNVVRLKEDLESGRWDDKYGVIRELDVIDVGYRFLCAKGAMPTII